MLAVVCIALQRWKETMAPRHDFDELPTELKCQIIRHLPVNATLQKVALLSKSWHAVLSSVPFAGSHVLQAMPTPRHLQPTIPLSYQSAILWLLLERASVDAFVGTVQPTRRLSPSLAHASFLACQRYLTRVPIPVQFMWSVHSGYTLIAAHLLAHNTVECDPRMRGNRAIQLATLFGYTDLARLLLRDGRADPGASNALALQNAAANGWDECVALLLEHAHVDPSVRDNVCVRMAAAHGHDRVVALLVKDALVDPAAVNNEAVTKAIRRGYGSVVEILLETGKVDPLADGGRSFNEARERGNKHIMAVLKNHFKKRETASDALNTRILVLGAVLTLVASAWWNWNSISFSI
ncbi:hypothetical protein BC830DRAFT_500548 [Chytriomyces sp. MP71]|nr:hypothetical protein BC830DRAFT_500548 [Chytriomyces sp. MP71]